MNDGKNLNKYQAERSAKKHEDVIKAVKHLKKKGKSFSLREIAKEAHVTPQFIYADKELYSFVKGNMEEDVPGGRPPKHGGASVKEKLEAGYKRLKEENAALRRENERLRKDETYKDELEELKKAYDALLLQLTGKNEKSALQEYGVVESALREEKTGEARTREKGRLPIQDRLRIAEQKNKELLNQVSVRVSQNDDLKKKYEEKCRECEALQKKNADLLNSKNKCESDADESDDDIIDMGLGFGSKGPGKYKA